MILSRLCHPATVPLLMGAAFVVACSGSETTGSDNLSVQPIDEILVGEIRIGQLTSTSAVLQVETSMDVVCSVVFGVDAFCMEHRRWIWVWAAAGTGCHAAPMRALQPETEYHYRLQGASRWDDLCQRSDNLPDSAAEETRQATNLAGSAARRSCDRGQQRLRQLPDVGRRARDRWRREHRVVLEQETATRPT